MNMSYLSPTYLFEIVILSLLISVDPEVVHRVLALVWREPLYNAVMAVPIYIMHRDPFPHICCRPRLVFTHPLIVLMYGGCCLTVVLFVLPLGSGMDTFAYILTLEIVTN